jgi:ADP-heptose:LPS heptosyltransferase
VNLLARFLGFVLRIDHSLDKNFNTIVISKYAGLGSIIQATPLIQTLRKKFPGSKMIFVSTEANEALLKHINGINEVILVSDKNLFSVMRTSFKLVQRMWHIKPDLYIDLEFYSNYSGIMTTLSKATNRFGFYKENKPYRKGIYNYLVSFNINRPISETYLQFARLTKCEEIINDLKINVYNGIDRDAIFRKLDLTKTKKHIIINPNASDLRLERRWPKEFYVKTIIYLLKEYPEYKVILIGNKMESAYVNEIQAVVPSNPNLVNSSGKLTLAELIILIAGAELMLTNDTGPMHIAFALNIKTISLFGPCSPQQYRQIKNGVSFYKKVACSPCVHKHLVPPCHGNNICMKNISVEEVIRALSQNIS